MKHCWVSSFDYSQSWTMFLLLFLLLNKLRECLHRDPSPVHSWRAMLVATRCRKMIRHSKFSNYRRDDYQSSAIYNQANLNTPTAYFTLRCNRKISPLAISHGAAVYHRTQGIVPVFINRPPIRYPNGSSGVRVSGGHLCIFMQKHRPSRQARPPTPTVALL